MPTLSEQHFLRSVRGKIILGFLLASMALGATWFISKLTFGQMADSLDDLARPDQKLELVNKIFKNILMLDQLQNSRTIRGKEQNQQVLAKSKELLKDLDSLSQLTLQNASLKEDTAIAMQIIRIDSMQKIIQRREELFSHYATFRSRLVDNKDLEDEVKSISGLITTTTKQKPDSTVVKTEKRTTTTYTYTDIPDTTQKAKARTGFLKRVFGGSKKTKIAPVQPAKIVQKQEVNVQVDTIKVAKEDSTIEKVGEAVQAIEKSQKKRTTSFIDREQELSDAGNLLVYQLLDVMHEVEKQAVKESKEESQVATHSALKNFEKLKWLILGFFLVIGLLAYFISTDIAKSNHYRHELEEAKEEAEYHSMAKQRFLSNMSHEIRTPLQSIIGYTEALKKDEKPKKQDLETLHSASEHLLYLVNEVLDYSRIISDRFTFEDRVFAISPLLNEVVQVLRPTALSKGLILRLENLLPPNLYLHGDPFRLRQILYNLLTNSIKFTDNGEVVLKVTGVEFGNDIQIEYHISDTGIGLSNEQMKRIFNQFEQADSSISRRFGGSGLGLSIVKALVEGMRGTIKVTSLQGQGTTFCVAARMRKAETLEVAEEAPERSYRISGKVWLVDDDAFILKWCSSVLKMNGIQHTSFSSAEEVLSRPWDDQVQFVLTDMRMSGMNGAEMCKRLRKVASSDTKFFVLTAQALPEERNNLLSMGFDGYLMKPFHSKELLELLEASSTIPAAPAQEPEIDFTSLNEMTFGDESLMREILDQFVKDSRHDVHALHEYLLDNDLDEVQELMHRMAGRTGQIGAKELSARFRHFEILLRENPSEASREEMHTLIEDAALIIEQVEGRALAYSI